MPSKKLTIAVYHESSRWSLPEKHLDALRAATGPDMELVAATNRAQLIDLLPTTTHLVGFPLSAEQIEADGGSLRWVQLTHASCDMSDQIVSAIAGGIRVCGAGPARSPQIAEHALAAALALLREFHSAVRAQTEHNWANAELAKKVRSIDGATIGVVSLGAIDDEIARRAAALGARTIATERLDATKPEFVAETFGLDRLNDMLALSDVVILAAPRLPMTHRLIGKKRLAAMKRSAILINVSRGGIVDDEALLEALRRSYISSAALDVFDAEPLPPTSPYWTMPNVLLTPHTAAASPTYWDRMTELACENIRRLQDSPNRPLVDELDPSWVGVAATA